ncbi:uncharacterized protein LOC128317288 [Pangasianodon hypophthalmus]|uniref:uncharacterized protein LOC128317288 n=1 Tax=Pangasianodon hypophthalmus TaxID=310915 RepID=UPI00230765E8|nr:uncharacterized protein LOC128317288 [Pangasianodon hypophthalmus]
MIEMEQYVLAGDCPIKLQPVKLAVEFGASASANCSTTINHHGMGWEASEGAVDMVDDVQFITWRVESLTHWDIEPICYINTNKQCELTLQVTVYKRPDRVSISTVGHTGPMIEGSQYELQCDVQNVAPVHLLTVNCKDDDGVQYRCEAELKLGPEGPQPPPVVTSDPLNITVHCDCPIKLQPVKLAVEFGASASANCSTTINHHGMGWEASEGAVDMVDDVQFITWRVESLTHWDIKPFCYINANEQCELTLQVTVYKPPDRVSISTVGHTGPMTEGSQYELECDVQNVAPVHLLTVNWYKGQRLVKSVESDHHSSITPVNYSNTLWISTSKDDDGVQYRCEAELKLGPEGPQPRPVVTSDPLNITEAGGATETI